MLYRTLLIAILLTSPSVFAAEDASATDQLKFFEMQVRPLLAQHCLECHSAEKQKGMLRLDSRVAMLKGGESEESAIVPGKPDESLLISAVRYESYEMPPKGKLTEKDISVLVKWIELGAPWPGGDDSLILRQDGDRINDEDRKWWAVQPVTKPEVPKDGDSWARNEVDRFIARKLKGSGLEPAQAADRYELVRRAYFDLHGLPPTPEQIETFVSDDRPDAWQRLIDDLLESPRYGERWAQHWLDVVRYAESDGYREDAYRPTASVYRDYVIRSLTEDKPYDQFVREHLAGDEIAPNDPDVFIGTAFLRNGVYEWSQRDVRMHWDLILNEMTRVTGEVFLGIGIGCAQCHDHKFDPILQKDYYGLQAFFSTVAWPVDRPLATAEQIAAHQKQQQKWEAATQTIRDEIEELVGNSVEASRQGIVDQFPEDIQAIYRKPESEKTTFEIQLSYLVWRQAERAAKSYDRAKGLKKSPEKLKRYTELLTELKKFDSLKPKPLPNAFVATDIGTTPAPTYLLTRTTKEAVEPSFLTLLSDRNPEIHPTTTTTGRRTTLANWITREDNPLSTRVIVNRIWQRHFGKGIVSTPNDFGLLGEPPSHPELLDWLTRRFLDGGWKLKPLHKLIMNSASYRQTARREPSETGQWSWSSADGLPSKIDPENRLLWRFPPRRLDAEQLRDSMLAVSGELKHRNGGRSVSGATPNRSVYVMKKRNSPDEMLSGFDAPLCFDSAPDRVSTTTPIQSLLLVNGDWTLKRSQAFAKRLLAGKNALTADDIRKAYRLAFGRNAFENEITDAFVFIREQSASITIPEVVVNHPNETGLRPITEHFEKVSGFGLGKKAIWFQPGSRFERLHVKQADGLDDQFTVESVVVLDRLYPDASANSLISRWNSNSRAHGWTIAVTSTKSAYDPRNFVVALAGRNVQDQPVYEVVASGLRFPLHKPVYLAAVISATTSDDNPTAGSVTFYMKDLSDPDSPVQVSKVTTSVVSKIQNPAMKITVGGRDAPGHLWDGQFARLTISRGALPRQQLLIGEEPESAARILDWQFHDEDGEQPAPNTEWLRSNPNGGRSVVEMRTLGAVTDFCHALFNSNEFLYLQ